MSHVEFLGGEFVVDEGEEFLEEVVWGHAGDGEDDLDYHGGDEEFGDVSVPAV